MTSQLLGLLRRQSGATGGDRRLDSRLRKGDDIGVALDDDDLPRPRHRALGAVEVVEGVALAVDRRLRRVQVLRAVVAATGEDPGADTDRAALEVAHGERDAPAEPVAHRAAPLVAEGEPRLDEDLRGDRGLQVPPEEIRRLRREPDAERLRRLGIDAARAEIGPRPLCLRRGQERAVVGGDGALVRVVEGLAAGGGGPGLRGVPLVAKGDVRLPGEAFHGLREGEALELAQEPDRVPGRAAAEAVVEPLRGRDRERRGLLGVERTEPRHRVRAGSLQREELRDEPREVGPLADRLDVLLADATGHG